MLLKIQKNDIYCLSADKTYIETINNCFGKNVLKISEVSYNSEEKLVKFLFDQKLLWCSEFYFMVENKILNQILGPNFSLRPGIAVLDFICENNLAKDFVCDCLDLSIEELNLLILGHLPIDNFLAKKLSKMFRNQKNFNSKHFWLKTENNYRQNLRDYRNNLKNSFEQI